MAGPSWLAGALAAVMIAIADRLTSRARGKAAITARSTASDHARVLVTSGAAAASSQDALAPSVTSGSAGDRQEHPAGVPMLAPGLAESYKIAMGIAMGYMLILMV